MNEIGKKESIKKKGKKKQKHPVNQVSQPNSTI
jgi:hypothetical protein